MRLFLECLSDHHSRLVHEFSSGELFSGEQFHFLEASVLVEGHGGVEEEVVVADGVHASVGQEEADVSVQLLAYLEGSSELLHECLFLFGELVGPFGLYGGEVAAGHRIFFSL